MGGKWLGWEGGEWDGVEGSVERQSGFEDPHGHLLQFPAFKVNLNEFFFFM